MRWRAKRQDLYRPGFALWPLRDVDTGQMIWLERIWVRDAGMYVEWTRWEERPNDYCFVCGTPLQTGPGGADCPARNPDMFDGEAA